MARYITLWNWTDQGVRNVKDSPKRVEAFRQTIEKEGGKLQSFFYTMGQYDGAAVIEAPNDEAYMKIAMDLGSLGNVRTTTLKAWLDSEAAKIIGKL